MKKLSILSTVVLLCIIFFNMNAYSKTIYSIHDLCSIADKTSETILNAREDVYLAEQDKARALSVLVPGGNVYGVATRYKNNDSSSPDTTLYGAKLSQSFTLNGKELIAYDVTKRTIEEKNFSLDSARGNYYLRISNGFFNILSADRFLEIADSEVKRLTTHRDGVKEKLDVGNVTKTAHHRAEAELSKARTDRVVAHNRVRKAKAALFNLIEIDDDFDISIKGIEGLENYQTTVEKVIDGALSQRDELNAAKKSVEIAARTIQYEKGAYWPSLSFDFWYKETEIEYESSGTDVRYDTEDLYVTGEIAFKFFDGGLRKADVRKAKSNLRRAKNGLSLLEKNIILESKNAFYEYDTAQKALINLEHEIKSAQENFKAVNMQFQHGMADSTDIMDANTLLVSAEQRITDAKYTLHLSILKLIHTQGNIVSFLSKKKL